jgi:hypothetical protein
MSSGIKSPHVGVKAEIKDIRFRAVLVFENGNSLGRNDFGNRIVGIFQICQSPSAERTTIDAGRL